MGHTHRHQFGFEKKNQVKSPSIWSRVSETGSDPPIGSDRDSGRDMVSQNLEHNPHMTLMLLLRLGVDPDVVNEDHDELI